MTFINQSADQRTGNTTMPVFASEETSRKRSQDDVSEASRSVRFLVFGSTVWKSTVIHLHHVEFLSQPLEGQSFELTRLPNIR